MRCRQQRARGFRGSARPPGLGHSEQQRWAPNERPHRPEPWPIAQGPNRQRRISACACWHRHGRWWQGRPRQQAQAAVAIAGSILLRGTSVSGRTNAEPPPLPQVLRQRGSWRQQRRPQSQHAQGDSQPLPAGRKSAGLKHGVILKDPFRSPPMGPQRPAHSGKTGAARQYETPQWPLVRLGR